MDLRDASASKNVPMSVISVEKTFKDKGYLKIHKMNHDGENEFFCDDCDKSFLYKSGLMKHKRKIHKSGK